jgi:hypothetical protein
VPDLKQQLLNMQRQLGLNPNEVRERLRLLLIGDVWLLTCRRWIGCTPIASTRYLFI